MSRLSIPSLLLQAARRPAQTVASNASQRIATIRSFSGLPSLRPTLPGAQPSTVFRPACSPLARLPQPPQAGADALDLVPKSSITAHPALAAIQIRCGPRPTMSNASRLIRARRHGFLSRVKTAKGRKLLALRRAKGRKRLSA